MKESGLGRQSKESLTSHIESELRSREAFFIAQHGSLPAAAMDRLRAKLRPTKTRYLVVKNTLGRRAFEKAKLSAMVRFISGPCGIAFSSGDLVASAKALVDFAKENENFKIQSGYFKGEVLDPLRVNRIAGLPTREVLLARLAGGIQAPLSRFVGVLSGTIRKVVAVLDALAKKKAS